jgi:hypothetical protein
MQPIAFDDGFDGRDGCYATPRRVTQDRVAWLSISRCGAAHGPHRTNGARQAGS